MAAGLDEQAVQEERTRLARDLHDSITQALFAAALRAEALTQDDAIPARGAGMAEEVQEALPPTHFGLRSMREPAAEVGAELRLVSAPGEGTLVMLDWYDDRVLAPQPG